MGYGVSARWECRSGRPHSSLATHHASRANNIALLCPLVFGLMRCGLALTLGGDEPAFVVMQFNHEKEVELRQDSGPRQDSMELASMMG